MGDYNKTEAGYDVVYFLTCKPVNAQGQELNDPKKWRSAVVHYSQVKLSTLNGGIPLEEGKSEFAWVTHEGLRQWEGFMYDVSFCERHNQANHFRFMIDPRGSKIQGPGWRENEMCGFAAKVPKPEGQHERSPMVPIYRADQGKIVKIGHYDCFREYYVTAAPPPPIGDTYKNRNQGKPMTLFEKPGTITNSNKNFHRRVQGGADDSGEPQPERNMQEGMEGFVKRDDLPADVEAYLDMTGGVLADPVNSEDLPSLGDVPQLPDPNSADDPDHFQGEDTNAEQNMFAPGEF